MLQKQLNQIAVTIENPINTCNKYPSKKVLRLVTGILFTIHVMAKFCRF